MLVKAFRDQPIAGTVTRTSWALNVKSRTLRAEIDLPNPDSQLLPGMYAYAKVIIERPGVLAVPLIGADLRRREDLLLDVSRTARPSGSRSRPVSLGDRDPAIHRRSQWIEVTNRQVPPSPGGADHWTPIDGKEQVILGDL